MLVVLASAADGSMRLPAFAEGLSGQTRQSRRLLACEGSKSTSTLAALIGCEEGCQRKSQLAPLA